MRINVAKAAPQRSLCEYMRIQARGNKMNSLDFKNVDFFRRVCITATVIALFSISGASEATVVETSHSIILRPRQGWWDGA